MCKSNSVLFVQIKLHSHSQVLQQVAAAEDCPLSPDAAASIAGMADGDVRSAIQTLQAMFAGHHSQASVRLPFSSPSFPLSLSLSLILLLSHHNSYTCFPTYPPSLATSHRLQPKAKVEAKALVERPPKKCRRSALQGVAWWALRLNALQAHR